MWSKHITTSLLLGACLAALGVPTAALADPPVKFENHRPQDWTGACNARSELFLDPVSGRWKLRAPNGKVTYAHGYTTFVRIDGKLYVGGPHTEIASGVHGFPGPVEYAGEIKFAGEGLLKNELLFRGGGPDLRGMMDHWTNGSGHYRPWARAACQAGLPMELFQDAGFGESGVAPKVFPPDYFDLGPGRPPRLPFRPTNPFERITGNPGQKFFDFSKVKCPNVVPDNFNAGPARPGFFGTIGAGMAGGAVGNWGARELCSQFTDDDDKLDFWGELGGVWGGVGATCAAAPEGAPFAVIGGVVETGLIPVKDAHARQPNYWYAPGRFNVVGEAPLPGATWSAISCHGQASPPTGRAKNPRGRKDFYDMVYRDAIRRGGGRGPVAQVDPDPPCRCDEGDGNVRVAAVDPPFDGGDGDTANGCVCAAARDGSLSLAFGLPFVALFLAMRRKRTVPRARS